MLFGNQVVNMKMILYLVIKSTPDAIHTLEEIRKAGYNATVMTTESLRHATEELPEERHFFTLRHVEKVQTNDSVLCLFIVDEDKLANLKEVIRENTDNFKKIKGFMFSRPIEDYEGSI